MRQALGTLPARVRWCGKPGQDVVVEEMGERPVAHVVQEAGDAQGLDDQALRRNRLAGVDPLECLPEARIEMPRPEPGFVHHAEAVREP